MEKKIIIFSTRNARAAGFVCGQRHHCSEYVLELCVLATNCPANDKHKKTIDVDRRGNSDLRWQ